MTETLSPALPNDVEALTERLLDAACKQDIKLATAESCTGGLLSSLLTDIDGSGHAFERGFTVYSEDAKCDLLGVARDAIDDCGAVSRDVAIAMAKGAIANSRADVALAVTGFAGPAGPGDEPGLVHFACARRDGDVAHREEHFGDIGRGPTRIECLRVGLQMMIEAVGA